MDPKMNSKKEKQKAIVQEKNCFKSGFAS